jgi:hypothetical protein
VQACWSEQTVSDLRQIIGENYDFPQKTIGHQKSSFFYRHNSLQIDRMSRQLKTVCQRSTQNKKMALSISKATGSVSISIKPALLQQ